jgi:EAL domain-containing protein (putative c-di-GMP-specific phosphodiesterase class I)/GGDEF domain-containing protein
MKQAPIPANELQRLAELQSFEILDTKQETIYDDLGEIARCIAGTPIGLISLVDENRQWFKTCLGLGTKETPRSISFCGHTILNKQALIIPDTLQNPDFVDNPLVVGEPYIRFYAGFPLVSNSGLSIGTICVISPSPQTLNPSQQIGLNLLAKQVISVMEHRRELKLLRQCQSMLILGNGVLAPTQKKQIIGLLERPELLATLNMLLSRRPISPFSLLLIRIKQLDRINALLGSDAVEHVVNQTAERLIALIPPGCAVGRYAEHEIAAVIMEKDRKHLEDMGQQWLASLSKPIIHQSQSIEIALGCGISDLIDEYTEAEDLIRAASFAQLAASQKSCSEWRFIDRKSHLQAEEDLHKETNLRKAIRDQELIPYYQPLINLETEEIVGVEVLARWPMGVNKTISPAEFMPLAYKLNLTDQIDLMMATKALEASQRLSKVFQKKSFKLSMNISSQLLSQDGRRNELIELIKKHEYPVNWQLQVEVLEEDLALAKHWLLDFFQQLEALNVTIAIDDFGSGYSSLARLHDYPFSCLKVDRSIVERLFGPSKPTDRLLEAILRIANEIDLQVTAEGIETELQRHWLIKHGYKEGQGNLFAAPMAEADLIQFALSRAEMVSRP